MKTTLDLPDALIREIKLRAVHQGRKLKDVIAELLATGLNAPAASSVPSGPLPKKLPLIKVNPQTKLPYIECARPAAPAEELTPKRVDALLLDQEVNWRHEAG